MPCSVYAQRYAIQNVRNKLRVAEINGFDPLSDLYKAIYKVQADLGLSVGWMKPKKMTLLRILAGLSPGSIKIWLDSDSGWFTEARVQDEALPVYHYVSDDVAMTLLKGELTHELEATLMTPDEYLGE